jgi:hypothetical protein
MTPMNLPAIVKAAARVAAWAAACAASFAASVLAPSPSRAQAPAASELRNPKLIVDYIEPVSDQYQDIYQRLKKRQVLEELAQFLSPLKLPLTLRLKTAECGEIMPDYEPLELRVRLCYEWIEFAEKRAPKPDERLSGLISRSDAIAGSTVAILLHEVGHALFDILEVPVLGREEDAADQIAGFIMLQFGKDVARTAINGSAFTWITRASTSTKPNLADAHSTPQQRVYTFACIAYGGDPTTFGDYVQRELLPKERAANCKSEYEQAKTAFSKTILQYVDLDLMKKVQARAWDLSLDGK